MPTLLPCPFCAAETAIASQGGASIWIECRSCGGASKLCVTELEAISCWNARGGTGYAEEFCPGHVASESDARICGRCGVHVDSLRPD